MAAPRTDPEVGPQPIDVLRLAEAFQGLPDAALRQLASATRARRYAAGEVLMREGDPAPCLHVLAAGRVRVAMRAKEPPGAEVELAVLGPGEVVGEMGLLDGAPRSATVTAIEATTTFELPAEVVSVAIVQYPTVTAALLRTVSMRLRTANGLIRQLAEGHADWSGPW